MQLRLSRSRLASIGALAVIAVAVAGCNPGSLRTTTMNGSLVGGNQGDRLNVSMTCGVAISDNRNNCTGHIVGVIGGKPFVTTAGYGGFQNVTIQPNGTYTSYDCNSGTTCTQSGHFDFGNSTNGYALWGLQRVGWELSGYDFDPAEDGVTLNPGVTLPDTATLTITSGPTSTFTCTNSCLEVVNRPNPPTATSTTG